VLNFLIIIIGIKQFGKEHWGTLIQITIWVSLLVFILNWGNKDYLIRNYSKKPAEIYHYFFSSFFSRSMLLPLAFLLLLFFPRPIALAAIVLVLLMHCYNSFESLVVYHQRFGAQLMAEIIGFCIILGGIYYSDTFTLVLFLQLYCFAFLVKILYLFTALKLWQAPKKFTLTLAQFTGSLSFFLLGLSGLIYSKIDMYFVNSFLPSTKISDYQLITAAFLMLQSVSGFIITPVNKQFYRSQNQTIEKVKTIFKQIAIPLVLMGSAGIWIILEKWVNLGLDLKIYGIGVLICLPSFYYIVPILNLYKKHLENKVLLANVTVAVLNAIVTLTLLPTMGILGALISVCLSQWVYLFIILKYDNRHEN
jgi:O-antigen/teichoic acid export membrane protein